MKLGKPSMKITSFVLVSLLCIAGFASAGIENTSFESSAAPLNEDALDYEGTLRLYVVEPVSRWLDYDGGDYHYGFLDFAAVEPVSIADQQTYEMTTTWSGDVDADNVMVIAAVFNDNPQAGFANPPTGYPFEAHYVDASAGAHPGETAYNFINETYTHSVFAEEGTATWCPYCPSVGNALSEAYYQYDVPFYFVALISDMNPTAADRLSELNLYAYPSVFFDGGYKVSVGGGGSGASFANRIMNYAQQNVHKLNLSVSVEYVGDGDLEISTSITNIGNQHAPSVDSPVGPFEGNVGFTYSYAATGIDPEDDAVSYQFDWGDGEISDWSRTRNSGSEYSENHIWTEQGDYDVRVRVKDEIGYVGEWSEPTTVTIAPPLIEIEIKGNIAGIQAVVTNADEETIPFAVWDIAVSGGITGGIECSRNGTIEDFESGDSKTLITTDPIFGLGSIDIEVSVGGTTKTAQGFVFGFIVFVT